jgi:hypothetical protein
MSYTTTTFKHLAIPEKNPWSLEDIISCKDIPFEKVLKDYANLVKFSADTNPKKFCGNKVLYYYQFRNLLKCVRDGKSAKTIWQIYEDPVLIQKLWDDAIKRNCRDTCPYPSPCDLYESQRINTGAIVFFKSSTAKFIYKKFQSQSVLDFTAGWGGRMLGAMSLGIKYTGIDTNLKLKEGYDKMMDELPVANKEDYRMIWDSCLDVDYEIIDYDLILTSPPYVNMELYEGMPPFESDDAFYNEFLIPAMNSAFAGMKEGGKMCINISPKMFRTLTEIYGYRLPDSQIDLRQQMGKNFAVKSQDYIYIWEKPERIDC